MPGYADVAFFAAAVLVAVALVVAAFLGAAVLAAAVLVPATPALFFSAAGKTSWLTGLPGCGPALCPALSPDRREGPRSPRAATRTASGLMPADEP